MTDLLTRARTWLSQQPSFERSLDDMHPEVIVGELARELERLTADRDAAREVYLTLQQSSAKLVADNKRQREALKPFALFAESNVGEDGWEGSGCQKDRVVDWFGPSDFRRACSALQHEAGET